MRPPNPKDLGFTINHEYLEAQDFIVGDIRVDSARHILLATPKQREILRTTRRWFMDGTFKVIDVPFQGGQLMSIHGFVQSDGVMKQLPLMFVVMSRRRKDDYVAVLRQVKDILGDVSVQGFVLDFEAAAWGAIRDVFPGLQIKGCTFHWAQSVWRHVQSIGLGPAYMERKSVWDWIRKLLVLPFLPSNHIATTFNSLAARATNDQQKELVHYIRQQWIESELFPIESWCVFRYRIRTNNDVEGWHNRLNSDCGYRSLSFYRMVPALRKQALDTEIDIDELLDHGVGRQQRRQTRHCEKEISELWDQYEKKGTECHQIPSRNQPCLWTSRVPAPDGDSGHGRKRKRGEEQQSVVSELEVSTDILNDEDIDVMIDNLNRFMKKSNMDQLEQVVKQSKNVKELTAGLGIHLVAKLAENASVRYGHKGDYKCPCGCDSKLQQDPDMWIGSEELWHGELDLISGNKATGDSLVAFSVSNEVETEENNDDEGVLTFEHINSSKEGNSTQEMRYRGENETFKDNTVDWSQIKSSRTATIMSHVVAQSIVFAFTERNRHKNKGRLFPSVLLTPAFFQVFIYNPVDDLLFRSNQFYFSFDENDCRPFFILWIILNHRIFLVEKLSNSLKVSCSGFKRVMESVPEKISIFKMLDSYEPEISVKKCSDSGHTVYPHEMIDHECYIEAMKRCASESDCQR